MKLLFDVYFKNLKIEHLKQWEDYMYKLYVIEDADYFTAKFLKESRMFTFYRANSVYGRGWGEKIYQWVVES
ncbi:hypothetical protein MNBD_UNCLBAC01-356 [hydrothermal vent metagenome]|uniref:Uncharacterized protein n=1 Tax=hydrothermal vent metagenome TaxID=652676 RepID=A0A3B1DGH5_9ZZZZ